MIGDGEDADVPYEFNRGFPEDQTSRRIGEEQTLARAIEAYRFFYPTVSMEGILEGQREAGCEDNRGCLLLECGPRHRLFTGNSDTPYLGAALDLRAGPMVIEVPPGPYVGLVDDHNHRWVMDLGVPGPDAGKGGRHLVLPPGHTLPIPDGYHAGHSPTQIVLLGVRAVPVGGDAATALNSLRQIRFYPLAQARRPPRINFIEATDRAIDTSCLRWEDNLEFWLRLHQVIDSEPAFTEYRPMYGLLATLGIERGNPFQPDERMQAILGRAARLGRDQLLVEAFASERPDRMVWRDRRWEWVVLRPENGDFEAQSALDIEARERWFAQAIGASPAMTRRQMGSGSLYWLGHRDAAGVYLDGGRNYRLNVPQPVPAQQFWSVTAYDAGTRSQIQTDQDKAALRSLFEDFVASADGSIDLYFGPDAPIGREGQWLKTQPGRGWFSYFRIYGPLARVFSDEWKPGDFLPVG